jgi:hypothetical protein
VLPAVIEPGKPVELVVSVEPEPTPKPEPKPEPEPVVIPLPEPEPELIVVKVEPDPIQPELPVVTQEKVVEPEVKPIPESEVIVSELEKMLPLTLYFHNDEPDSNTLAITTKTNYTQAYNSFMAYKEMYVREFSTQFKDNEQKITASDRVRNFFDNTVTKQFQRMNEFMALLLIFMERGESIEISVRGFCSPRSSTNYNVNLAPCRNIQIAVKLNL